MATVAQAYLLLLLDEQSGKPLIAGTHMKYGLAGAVLADLALTGRIALSDTSAGTKPGKIIVVSQEPVGDPVTDASLRELAADKPRGPQAVIARISRDIRSRVLDQLVDAGIVRQEEGRILGVFPRESWPTESARMEQEIRAGLRQVLLAGEPPSAEQAALIALLEVTGGLRYTVPGEQQHMMSGRAEELATLEWTPRAAKEVVDATRDAIVVAMSAAATAGDLTG